jgi:hypothetical protein
MGREVHRVTDAKLREHFSQPVPQPAFLAESNRAASSAQRRSNVTASSADQGEEIELQEKKLE